MKRTLIAAVVTVIATGSAYAAPFDALNSAKDAALGEAGMQTMGEQMTVDADSYIYPDSRGLNTVETKDIYVFSSNIDHDKVKQEAARYR